MSGFYIDNRQYHSGPDHITVEHKRAPTDASVALLKEMESNVLDKIIADLPVVDNIFNFHGIMIRPEIGLDKICYSFSLNGEKISGQIDIPGVRVKSHMDIINEIYENLGKDIAKKIIELALRNSEENDFIFSLKNIFK